MAWRPACARMPISKWSPRASGHGGAGVNPSGRSLEAAFESFLAELLSHRPGMELREVRRAFALARGAHAGQRRCSGEEFVAHPLAVASILLGLLRRSTDTTILCAALLHDTVEDSAAVSLERIQREFGPEVAALVDGVTKIGDLPFRAPEVTQTENYRKMLLSMSKDIRVILIKLADRLHNMRTLAALDPQRQRRIAQETFDIYAPIAHRLGIARIRWELEDLAFKYLDPEHYRMLVAKIDEKRTERERAIDELVGPLRRGLTERGIQAEVTGRPKHLWSIWSKMRRLQAPFEEIFDLLGIRIVTESRDDCYRVLGVIHDLYTPVADRFKDYIATPKSNMYQSLHTAVIVPERRRMVEIQIRTREMHVISEIGIAAHYAYKEGGITDRELQEKLGDFIVQGTTEWQDDADSPGEFMDFLKTSLYQDEVFVFTPRGGLKRLPRGATPIDFAYAIHTDIGHHCVGAKVNGRIVPLRYQLKSGEVVAVITSQQGQPSEDWLQTVASSRAKGKIRRWITQQRLESSVRLGRDMLARELRKRHLKLPADKDLEDVSQSFGLPDVPLLYAKVGQGDLSVASVIGRLHPETKPEEKRRGASALDRIRRLASRPVKGLRIDDVDGLLIRIAQCCQPLPGDKVIGIITKGRGISVHRLDCPNTFDDRVPPERKIEVQWDVEREQEFLVRLIVHCSDRASILSEVAGAVSRTASDLRHGAMGSDGGGLARGEFVLTVRNLSHLGRVISAVRRVRGVHSVERASTAVEATDTDEEGASRD